MQIISLCRVHFEKEVAAELSAMAAGMQVSAYAKASPGTGYVVLVCADKATAEKLLQTVLVDSLIFVRHWFVTAGLISDLDINDRVSPLADALQKVPNWQRLEGVVLDTNEGKSLGRLNKALCAHIAGRVKRCDADVSGDREVPVAQLLLLSGDSGYVGYYYRSKGPKAPNGLMRLKFPRGAPSRSTLKLEEAWHHFIPADQWASRLRPGMRAVDLGAAPGGWTWQLVRQSLFVDAVDNGPMNAELLDSGQVTHHRLDGFRYQPSQPVDWLVCDIADKPKKVAALILKWALNGWFGEAVFNIKLPMKQRYAAVVECSKHIGEGLDAAGINYTLHFKQLYHDREEVTGHLAML